MTPRGEVAPTPLDVARKQRLERSSNATAFRWMAGFWAAATLALGGFIAYEIAEGDPGTPEYAQVAIDAALGGVTLVTVLKAAEESRHAASIDGAITAAGLRPPDPQPEQTPAPPPVVIE